jgi:hypothetical protein
MDLLLATLLLALSVWGFRKVHARVRQSRARSARAAMPGSSPDNPLLLQSARVLEAARAAQRCECGGRVLELGETSRLGLRVARGRCVECDADVDLYFTLPELLN